MNTLGRSGIILMGYYGHDNLGDDLLLLSTLMILKEANVKNEIYIPAPKNIEKLRKNFPEGLKIKVIPRYNPYTLERYFRRSCCTIFGGGNLFQDETSTRSFLYYHFVAKRTLKRKNSLVFLSQGFGPIHKQRNRKQLKKVLTNERSYGVIRDKVSYRYASRFSKNYQLGTDYGPHYLLRKNLIVSKPEKDPELAFTILKSGTSASEVVEALKYLGYRKLCAVGFHNSHDSQKQIELEDYAVNNGMEIIRPPQNIDGVMELLSKASIVVTERLHGAILATVQGTPFVWKKNRKINRFVSSLVNDYCFGFDNNLESIVLTINGALRYDFEKLRSTYLEKLDETVERSIKLINKILD